MKIFFRYLLVMLFAVVQVPVLPVMALLIAQTDNSHRICIEEEEGVVTIALRHVQFKSFHNDVLDMLVHFEGVNDESEDHVMRFLHTGLLFEEFKSCDDDSQASVYCDVILNEYSPLINKVDHVSPELPRLSYRQVGIARVPLGLKHTVMLV